MVFFFKLGNVCKLINQIMRVVSYKFNYELLHLPFLKQRFNHSLVKPAVEPTHLSSSPYMNILQLGIDRENLKHGNVIHGHVIRNGLDSNIHLSTKLIIFYVKLRDMTSARKVFDEMSERSVVSWTALISGYTHSGCYRDALLVFSEMVRTGVKANQFAYGSVLRACTGLRCWWRGMQIQGCIQKSRFYNNLFVLSALVDLHSKCGNVEGACYLFETMSEKDVVSWNAMIGGYAAQGLAEDSFRMFHSMMGEGVIPDCFTFGSVLKASSRANNYTKVCQIHGVIIRLGYGSYIDLNGSLIDAYAKCKSTRNAYHLYKNMIKKDAISFTALMAGYARNDSYSREVLDLFKDIQHICMEIDDVTLCTMLNLCANMVLLSTGRQIHALAIKRKPSYDVPMGNALVDMYTKSGEIEDATRAFREMKVKNVISWTSLIAGYGKHGYGLEAIALYKKMENEGLKPNDITFLSLLFACSHSGLTDEGWECFNNMINKYDILPRAEHFACMVDLLARGGQLEEAYDMVCKMKIRPNAALWGAILGGCSIYGDRSLGEVAAAQLFQVDPENSANYVVLASIYAAAGAWNDSFKMRNLMINRSLKKIPGYSLVQSAKQKMTLLQPR